ncbi:MAG: hypothetical protein ACYDCL_20110 [Myxococcales bacterium]
MAVVLLGLLAVGSLWFFVPGRGRADRTQWSSVVCPQSRETFALVILRHPSSERWVDVLSCSHFFPTTRVTCDKLCLRELNVVGLESLRAGG